MVKVSLAAILAEYGEALCRVRGQSVDEHMLRGKKHKRGSRKGPRPPGPPPKQVRKD